MKDFNHWGLKRRVFPDYNYNAIWSPNLKTIRLGEGVAKNFRLIKQSSTMWVLTLFVMQNVHSVT